MSQSAKDNNHCLKPLATRTHTRQLTRQQWQQLKEALLFAKLNTETPAIGYQALTDTLKQHPIGQLIASALYDNNTSALDHAAQQLAPNTPNYWVALMRS